MEVERPLGYWLKHLDRLIEAAFDRVLAEAGLGRRHWQVLNCLRSSARTEEEIVEALRPFWGPGAIPVDEVLGELVRRGWVAGDGAGRHALTPDGAAGHTAIQEKVNAIRAATASGLTEEDYQRTIATLRRMAENLESVAS